MRRDYGRRKRNEHIPQKKPDFMAAFSLESSFKVQCEPYVFGFGLRHKGYKRREEESSTEISRELDLVAIIIVEMC